MPRFRYDALDALGTPTSGELEDVSSDAARAALESYGLEVRSVVAVGVEHGWVRLPDSDARALVHHIAGLTRSGLPLQGGLKALREELEGGPLRDVVDELAGQLERGESLDTALGGQAKRFPGYLRGLVTAAVRSGKIGLVLGDFVTFAQNSAAIRRELWMGLVYPLLLLFAFVQLALFFCFYIVQQFESIYSDFGIDLPVLTRALIRTSRIFTSVGAGMLWGPVAIVLVGVVVSRFILDPASRRDLACRIPLFGSMWRWLSLAEFSRYLALLLECNLTAADAVPLAAQGARDPTVIRAAYESETSLRRGGALADAFGPTGLLPPGLIRMLRWGETGGSLVPTLNLAAEMFEARAQAQASFAGGLVTVIIVLLVLWGTAFLVVALFLPLIQLITKLSG